MSENRNRYSSAPLQNLKQAKKRSKAAPKTPGIASSRPARSTHNFPLLQLLLIVILPLLFVVSLFVKDNLLFLIFAALSVLSLMVAWIFSAFLTNARATLTILHIAMVVVALFAVLLSPPKVVQDTTASTVQGDQSAKDSLLSASMISMMQNQQQLAGPTATPNPGNASFAQQRLQDFMGAWSRINYAEMASYCLPSWINQQDSAETAMFHLRANRTIVSYEVLEITGNDSDQTRTIHMNAVIDKSNGNPPETHRFQVLMVRINNEWYVDPRSLSSIGIIETEAEIAARTIATIVPTATPPADTRLYYNPNGGRFYHLDPNCPSLLPEYLPMTASFYFGDINKPEFSQLVPCVTCRAPSRD